MKKNKPVSWSLMCAVFILVSGAGVAFASEPVGGEVSSPVSEWLIGIVDGTREVGYNVSVATDHMTGETYISYYEGVDGDLWLARTGAPSGNCGPGNTWECQVIDSGGVVGKYSSIAVGGPVGPEADLYITYHDASNGSLKVMEGTVERGTGILTFDTYAIESGNPGSNIYMGTETSVDLSGSGTPYVAYQVDLGAAQAVKYAVRVAPGTGNCGEGSGAGYWQCGNVQLDVGIGDYIDLDIGPGGIPNIAFSTTNDTYTYPMIAILVASGGTCNNSDVWNCAPIRNVNQDTGEHLSFEIAIGGTKQLAYRNSTMESLEWAQYVGPGSGNCGPGDDSYQCDWIDNIGPSGLPSGIALATDGDSEPIIAYQDVESGYEDLKIAWPVGGLPGSGGNCGPLSAFMEYMWRCETLEEGDLSHEEAVGGLSIALNANDEAAVAYRELWGTPPTDGRLKIAIEPISIFVDGFETGNTAAWSATVP